MSAPQTPRAVRVEATDKDPALAGCKLIQARNFTSEGYVAALVFAEEQRDAGYWVSFYLPDGECIFEYPIKG